MLEPREAEIRGLHEFFEAWYRGNVSNTDDAFSRVADVLAPEFTLIVSSGFSAGREQLVGMLRSEHATRPDLAMSVENPQLKLATDEIVLATYEEHGTTASGTWATMIPAVLGNHLTPADGLEWVRIHEVSLDSK